MSYKIDQKQLTHDRIANEFDSIMNPYDIKRRLEVLIDDFLGDVDLQGKQALDAGCGSGRGTQRLIERGAQVTSVDIGLNLLQYTQSHYPCKPVNASVMELPFAADTFDVVFSSEVIEHTPNPLLGIQEMVRVLKPGGYLVCSTPNWLWQFPVQLASAIKLRPYDGIENFLKPSEMKHKLNSLPGQVLEHRGLHLIPFQLTFLQSLSHYLDQFGTTLLPLMINQCVKFQKRIHS